LNVSISFFVKIKRPQDAERGNPARFVCGGGGGRGVR